MGWVDTPTAILSLRTLLFDGPTDKYASGKHVLGFVDGTNAVFKTFENRRVTDFTTATFPAGLFLNGVPIATANVTSDDISTGTFLLNGAGIPTQVPRQVITATYFYQYFYDADLNQFLLDASDWLGLGPNYINLDPGLNAAALRFAAQEAYETLAMRYSTRMSEIYKLEDAPSEDILKSVQAFKEMAEGFMDKASTMRNDFYTRQGQSLAPNYGFALGVVRDPVPRR